MLELRQLLVKEEISLHETVVTDKLCWLKILSKAHLVCVQLLVYLQIFNELILFFPSLLLPLQLFDSLPFEEMPFHLSKPVAAYEEALQLVKEGKVACRTLR